MSRHGDISSSEGKLWLWIHDNNRIWTRKFKVHGTNTWLFPLFSLVPSCHWQLLCLWIPLRFVYRFILFYFILFYLFFALPPTPPFPVFCASDTVGVCVFQVRREKRLSLFITFFFRKDDFFFRMLTGSPHTFVKMCSCLSETTFLFCRIFIFFFWFLELWCSHQRRVVVSHATPAYQRTGDGECAEDLWNCQGYQIRITWHGFDRLSGI